MFTSVCFLSQWRARSVAVLTMSADAWLQAAAAAAYYIDIRTPDVYSLKELSRRGIVIKQTCMHNRKGLRLIGALSVLALHLVSSMWAPCAI